MKRIISLLLCAVMFALLLCACTGGDTDKSKDPGVSGNVSGGTGEIINGINTATGLYEADIDPEIRYDGKTITFLTCGPNQDHESEILFNTYEDGESGSAMSTDVNEAIKERNNLTEQRFGVKIEEEYVYDPKRYGGEFLERVHRDLMGGDVNYQVLVPCLYDGANLAAAGDVVDLYTVKTIHLENPWWSQSVNEECTINGKLYFQLSDIGYTSASALPALAFNKQWVKEKQLDNPYELVRNGEWTVDAVIKMLKDCKGYYTNDDVSYRGVFGWGGQDDDLWYIFYGSGQKIATIGNDGLPYISIYNERSVTIMEKIQELVQDSTLYVSANDWWSNPDGERWPTVLTMRAFKEGRCLFFGGGLGSTSDYAGMQDDFGLVPFPKGDEFGTYHALANPWVATCFAIQKNVKGEELDMVGNVLEYMGAVSKNTVENKFINKVLQYQKTRDDETFEMIKDYILPYKGCDCGFIFKWGRLDVLIQEMRTKAFGSFPSEYDSKKDVAQSELEDTIALFTKE